MVAELNEAHAQLKQLSLSSDMEAENAHLRERYEEAQSQLDHSRAIIQELEETAQLEANLQSDLEREQSRRLEEKEIQLLAQVEEWEGTLAKQAEEINCLRAHLEQEQAEARDDRSS